MSGVFLSLLGFSILISSVGYNIFADELFEIFCIFWVFICYLLEKMCILLGRFFKIWHLKITTPNSSLENEKSIFLFFLNNFSRK